MLWRSCARFMSARREATSQPDFAYQAKILAEKNYKDVVDINVLPDILHYWSNKYLKPMLEEFGFSNPDQFFTKYLHESAEK